MKIKLKIFEFKNLHYMLENTFMTNTELAKVMFREFRDQEVKFLSAEQRITAKYEEEVMTEIVDEPNVDEPKKSKMKTVPIRQVPYEKQGDLTNELNSFEEEFEISSLTFPAWKNVVNNFPSQIKGIKGEAMINMYEDLKAKFNS